MGVGPLVLLLLEFLAVEFRNRVRNWEPSQWTSLRLGLGEKGSMSDHTIHSRLRLSS